MAEVPDASHASLAFDAIEGAWKVTNDLLGRQVNLGDGFIGEPHLAYDEDGFGYIASSSGRQSSLWLADDLFKEKVVQDHGHKVIVRDDGDIGWRNAMVEHTKKGLLMSHAGVDIPSKVCIFTRLQAGTVNAYWCLSLLLKTLDLQVYLSISHYIQKSWSSWETYRDTQGLPEGHLRRAQPTKHVKRKLTEDDLVNRPVRDQSVSTLFLIAMAAKLAIPLREHRKDTQVDAWKRFISALVHTAIVGASGSSLALQVWPRSRRVHVMCN